MRTTATTPALLAALAVATVALLAVGCGTGGLAAANADKARGQQLFKATCGGCHTLAAAGTAGTVGPNLDAAFGQLRNPKNPGQGFKESSIREVVHQQILYPGEQPADDPNPAMPAKLVTGADADAVAAYVASVAGLPVQGGGGKVTATGGKAVFTSAGCTSCHTLKDAGATGTIGPNLDQAKPSKSRVVDRVTNGKGAMPPFKGKLSPAQIQAVADYVSSVAGK